MSWFQPGNVMLLGGLSESYGPGYYGDRPTLGKYNPADNPAYRFYSAGLHEFASKPDQSVVYYSKQTTPAEYRHRGRLTKLNGLGAGASAPVFVYAGPGASSPLGGLLDTATGYLQSPLVAALLGGLLGYAAARYFTK